MDYTSSDYFSENGYNSIYSSMNGSKMS